MKKRVIAFIVVINILFLSLFGRILSICTLSPNISTHSARREKTIHTSRGFIYDRNYKPLINNGKNIYLVVKPATDTLIYFKEKDKKIFEIIRRGYLSISPYNKNEYIKSNNVKALETYKRYTDDTALHIIGYTDKAGNGICGIEKYFNKELKKCGGEISVKYNTDAKGELLRNEKAEICDNGYYDKDGLVLTIDKDIQNICETALKESTIEKGAIVVLDCKTNEILACCSVPTYDREKLWLYTQNNDSPFMNKAFCAFPVGSVFKVVTGATAIKNNLVISNFYCKGKTEKSGKVFRCSNLSGHKWIDFKSAMAESCNPYFIELGNLSGGEALVNTASKLGFGKAIDFGNGYKTETGILPDKKELSSSASVGNLAFGQGKLTATPIQIAAMFSVIANGGIYVKPSLIKGEIKKDGKPIINNRYHSEKVLDIRVCEILTDSLLETVKNGTGKLAHSEKTSVCGKTSTAQSGQFSKDGHEIMYCWFAGFFPSENPRYSICIVKEDGTSGGKDCCPVFKKIAEDMYYKKLKPSDSD